MLFPHNFFRNICKISRIFSLIQKIVCSDDHFRDKNFQIWANKNTKLKGVDRSDPSVIRIRISDIRSFKSEFVDGKGSKSYKNAQELTTFYNSLNSNEPSKQS